MNISDNNMIVWLSSSYNHVSWTCVMIVVTVILSSVHHHSLFVYKCDAFTTTAFPVLVPVPVHVHVKHTRSSLPSTSTFTVSSTSNHSRLYMNLFKDLIQQAFENDRNLSQDKSKGQLEDPSSTEQYYEYDYDYGATYQDVPVPKTEVQKRWLQATSSSTISTSTGTSTSTRTSKQNANPSQQTTKRAGAPVNPSLLVNTKWTLNLYLTGIPDFDPSNSLYGSRVNISTRKDSNMAKDGFAIGADSLPSQPTVSIQLQLLDNYFCKTDPSEFTTPITQQQLDTQAQPLLGRWKLSDDGRFIQLSFYTTGYTRTITTKGSIQNIYWSNETQKIRRTTATYSIPPGIIYAEATIEYGTSPGTFIMAKALTNQTTFTATRKNTPTSATTTTDSSAERVTGILRVEQKTGMFGVSTKFLPCGKFSAEMIQNTSST